MSLPILPDYIPNTTGSLHDEIKIRNMNVVISLIRNNPRVFGNDLEKALIKMRTYGMLTDYNEFAIMPDMSINTILDVNKFNELNFLDIDFLSTPVVE